MKKFRHCNNKGKQGIQMKDQTMSHTLVHVTTKANKAFRRKT